MIIHTKMLYNKILQNRTNHTKQNIIIIIIWALNQVSIVNQPAELHFNDTIIHVQPYKKNI